MSKTEGTIKVRNWFYIILFIAGLIGSGITTTIFALALATAPMDSEAFVNGFLLFLTVFNCFLVVGFAMLIFENITNKKYFKEVKVKID